MGNGRKRERKRHKDKEKAIRGQKRNEYW